MNPHHISHVLPSSQAGGIALSLLFFPHTSTSKSWPKLHREHDGARVNVFSGSLSLTRIRSCLCSEPCEASAGPGSLWLQQEQAQQGAAPN